MIHYWKSTFCITWFHTWRTIKFTARKGKMWVCGIIHKGTWGAGLTSICWPIYLALNNLVVCQRYIRTWFFSINRLPVHLIKRGIKEAHCYKKSKFLINLTLCKVIFNPHPPLPLEVNILLPYIIISVYYI